MHTFHVCRVFFLKCLDNIYNPFVWSIEWQQGIGITILKGQYEADLNLVAITKPLILVYKDE